MTTLPQRSVAKTPFKLPAQVIPSSSPAFATPLHPIRPALAGNKQDANRPAPILPILLPPATLRPIAFRTFTKKHNLTLTASALQALATFVGKHCGSGWREEGLAELVLEEIARSWKRAESKVIVDGEGTPLKNILKQLEGSMSGGRIVIGRSGSGLTRVTSLAGGESSNDGIALNRQDSFGMSTLEVEEEDESEEKDPRSWIKVISASEQPRMIYNPTRNHFEKYE
jgi:DNA polymerase epsilon subunit 2